MDWFIIGLLLSAVFLYEIAGTKKEETNGPFTDKNCNDAFNKLPPTQQTLVSNAVKAGNKKAIKDLANTVRTTYPDMANCLDTIGAALGIQESFTIAETSPVVSTTIGSMTAPSVIPVWKAEAKTCLYKTSSGAGVWESWLLNKDGRQGKVKLELLSKNTDGTWMAKVLSVTEKWDTKMTFPAVNDNLVLTIPSDVPDCSSMV